MPRILLLCLLAVPAFSQSYYSYHCKATSVTSLKCTIQQPSSPKRSARLVAVVAKTSTEGTGALEFNGAPATQTAVTVRSFPDSPTPTLLAFNASDSTGGNVIKDDYSLSAGVDKPIDLMYVKIVKKAGDNASFVTTTASAANHSILIIWQED